MLFDLIDGTSSRSSDNANKIANKTVIPQFRSIHSQTHIIRGSS